MPDAIKMSQRERARSTLQGVVGCVQEAVPSQQETTSSWPRYTTLDEDAIFYETSRKVAKEVVGAPWVLSGIDLRALLGWATDRRLHPVLLLF